jgi:PAS domain-containing protein
MGGEPVPQLVLRLAQLPVDTAAVPTPRLTGAPSALAGWTASVSAAHDPCLVLDPYGALAAISVPAADLLGCTGSSVLGRSLLDVVRLVDFEDGDPHPEYARRIPSLAVLSSRGLMRGLLRVEHVDGQRLTLDAVAGAIHDAGSAVVGSVTFLSLITPG